jgi:hypothetical protein
MRTDNWIDAVSPIRVQYIHIIHKMTHRPIKPNSFDENVTMCPYESKPLVKSKCLPNTVEGPLLI